MKSWFRSGPEEFLGTDLVDIGVRAAETLKCRAQEMAQVGCRRIVRPALALLGACQSSSKGSVASEVHLSSDPADCLCGDPRGDLYGCTYEGCVEGRGNPENPHCICQGLYASGSDRTSVSTGSGMANRLLGTRQAMIRKSGAVVWGDLVSDNGLTIEVVADSGKKIVLTYDDLDPKSVYRLMKARTPGDDYQGLRKQAGPGRSGSRQ